MQGPQTRARMKMGMPTWCERKNCPMKSHARGFSRAFAHSPNLKPPVLAERHGLIK
jgi:hypothetical protein